MTMNVETIRLNLLLDWLNESANECEHEATKQPSNSFGHGWYVGHKDACERTRFKIRELFFARNEVEATESADRPRAEPVPSGGRV